MALVLTCNECGEPIDEKGEFWSATVVQMNAPLPEGVPAMAPATVRMDWHEDHLPDGVNPPQLSKPILSSLNPTSADNDAGDTQVHALGSDFQNGATILFDGTSMGGTFYSQGQVMAIVPMTGVVAGQHSVVVRNPDGGQSDPLQFTVTE
jgi:IPT/TIG domain